MAQINKPNTYFNTVTYTGNGTTQSITGVNFQPDWTWIKERGAINNHELYDAVRGVTKRIYSDLTNAEDTNSIGLTAFGADGFTLGGAGGTNNNTDTYVAWNWLGANGTASNTDGSITSTVSANTTSGFSIVSYTGTGATATIGHGLGVAPAMIIVKQRNVSRNWVVGHNALGWTKYIYLDSNNASATGNLFNDTAPTSSVFSVINDGGVNASGGSYIAYCFAEKKGFSKFGSYTGNGNADGTFVYTGFKPAWVMIKGTHADSSWCIVDNKRSPENVVNKRLFPDASNGENTGDNTCDFLSNGFKLKSTDSGQNGSGLTYIYMAFAENALVGTNNIPATAR